jgi:hypothetical protein
MMGLAAFSVLAAGGVLSAVAALRAFARFTDAAKIRTAKRQIKASLYEMRLFLDEPAVLLRAQKRLLTANLRYLGMMLLPLAIIAIPMFLLMTGLDAVYGNRALIPGEAAVVTVDVRSSVDLESTVPAIEATPGLAIETPVVRIPAEHRFCWRIRAVRAGSSSLRVLLDGGVFEKSVRAGAGFTFLSRQRIRSLLAWMLDPTEARLPPGPVERIEVDYPASGVTAFGVTLHWMAWFFLAAVIAAICLR